MGYKEFWQLWDIRQLVKTLAVDIVGICYQETTNESGLKRLIVCSSDV
jgi:hypothetical protein